MSTRATSWQLSVLPVWILVAIGSVISLTMPDQIQGLAVSLIGGVLATFLAQLATRQPAGFVERARLSIVGVVILVALAGIIAFFIG